MPSPGDPCASRVQLAGRLRLEVGGEAREGALRGRQGRLLFAFLVLHRARPVRRDELVAAVWTQDGGPPSDSALAPVLSRVRAALAPGTIEGRDELALVLPEPPWIDVEEATRLLAQARDALRAQDPAQAAALATRCAALTAAGLLPGHDAPWLAEPRRAVEDERVEALELAAQAGVLLGGPELAAAEHAARAAVAAAPFRESARAALIRVLQARGNAAEAVRAFEEVRRLLRDELGTTPGPELVALHERGLGLRPPAEAAAPAPPAPPAPRASSARPGPSLVERERELADTEALLARLRDGEGGVAVLEGPAGVGKTRLLAEVRSRAAAEGARVLAARAAVLERDYGFGVVRQLFEDVVDEPGALAAAAAPARAVLVDAAGGDGVAEGAFPALHALFRLTANLAAADPLVLLVDDLQWSDPASLRFLGYLARRLAGLPVLLVVTVRTGEPTADEVSMAELLHDPSATTLRPRPLSEAGTRTLVRARLGPQAHDAFADACHEVTAGNPLLLHQLLTALRAEEVVPDAAHAAQVRAIGPRAVSRTVLLRLARLPAEAVRVARAVAVLGEAPALDAIAALAGVDEPAAAAAIGALARAEVLRDEAAIGFVHPLVRDAVYGELPAAQRGLEHARAARLLAERGASAEQVGAQLLRVAPHGDPWVVERLRDAARVALARGAPESAVAHLARARAEPPTPSLAATVALELGTAAAFVEGPAAVESLRQAHAALRDAQARGAAALRLSRLLLFLGDPSEGTDLARAARAELPAEHEDLRRGLEAVDLVGCYFGTRDPRELERLEGWTAGSVDGPGTRSLTALAALTTAVRSGPIEDALALAREALRDDVLLEHDPGVFPVTAMIVLAFDDPATSLPEWRRLQAFAQRRGSAIDAIGADLWGGLSRIWHGDLAGAEEALERASRAEQFWGTVPSAPQAFSAAFLALARVERGDLAGAHAALARTAGVEGRSDGARFWLVGRAELLLAERRLEEALADSERLEAMRPPEYHPVWSPWRSVRARALAGLGARDRALDLAADDLALARRSGAPWVVGRSLRLAGELAGEAGIGHLREAVALLAPTSARLEHAKALAALSDALVAAGRRDEAQDARRAAAAPAAACGAEALAARLASGALAA